MLMYRNKLHAWWCEPNIYASWSTSKLSEDGTVKHAKALQ